GNAARVANDLTAWRLRSVLGVTDRPQGGGIQKCPVIEVEQKHGRVGSEGVDLLERRESLLRKLMLGETTNDAYPLRRWRHGDLPLQHVHGVGERSHAVPPQLHVEIQATADDVKVVVDQTGQDAAALEVDDLRRGTCQSQHIRVRADAEEPAVP